jgi:NAD(P)-dependent dehydrogenase (short-subunit alcohol dehydrogenase family)
MLRLDGKVSLVTGCGSRGEGWGNGQAIAVLLARQGARVYGVDVDPQAGAATAARIAQDGGTACIEQADVTSETDVERMVADCVERFGRIDVLVNNVGRSEPGGPVEMASQVWEEQLRLNVTSAFLTCKHALPLMQEARAGSVVNVSSVAGLRYVGKPQVAYAAAKAALAQFTRTTAVICAPHGVRLNCVVPGLMFTPLVQRLADKYAQGDYEGFVAHRHRQVPMGRMGDAWDVAHAALFLASDESRYITAQELVVDGGLTAATR